MNQTINRFISLRIKPIIGDKFHIFAKKNH